MKQKSSHTAVVSKKTLKRSRIISLIVGALVTVGVIIAYLGYINPDALDSYNPQAGVGEGSFYIKILWYLFLIWLLAVIIWYLCGEDVPLPLQKTLRVLFNAIGWFAIGVAVTPWIMFGVNLLLHRLTN